MLRLPIYLDYNATTPVDPRVMEAMLPYFTEHFGNAASRSHGYGWKAEEAVDTARRQVAELIGAAAKEIVFTSGATESDNLAIKGVAEMYRSNGNHIITCRTEHKAVLDTCKALQQRGWEVTYLSPDAQGLVSAEQVEEAITENTILITIMAANNETGVLHPIGEIGRVAKRRGVLFHTDATQAAGKVPLNAEEMGVDLLSLSAHKIYGPKGIGALYVRRRDPRVRLAAQMHGGGHERNMRSGTLNVPGTVGFGEACRLAVGEMDSEPARLRELRDRLENGVFQRVEFVKRNGHPTRRLCNTSNLSFAYVEGEAIMLKMKSLAVSSGSACTSASLEPSYVLRAMGLPDDLGHSSLRFSLGRFTTQADVDYAVERIAAAIADLRDMSPLYESARETGETRDIEWASAK
ncbi:MAG: IscS subfamily cysteine desulfurase [Phycisphaerae bacterium]|nr:IscS subfamily cysteine desulfurase [Phycisphaerae bacterium]